jgi:hypothetical protein
MDHSQWVTRFPRVSPDQITVVYELLALNCHCPFISDIALTPTIARCTATDRQPLLIIPSCSLSPLAPPFAFVIVPWRLISLFVSTIPSTFLDYFCPF